MSTKIDKNTLTYRKKSFGIVIDKNDKFLLINKVGWDKNNWTIPGGGIDENETPEVALLRELEEELGTDKFEIIEYSKIKNTYDFPDHLIERHIKNGKNIRGQIAHQFIVRFTGNPTAISIQEDEIAEYKWVRYSELESHMIFDGQWENIRAVIEASSLKL